MTVLILATGTKGDVAPLIGLGTRLQEAGHSVAVATYEAFAEDVRNSGCEFRLLRGDPRDLVRPSMRKALEGRSNGRALRTGRTLRVLTDHMDTLRDDLVAVAGQGAELLMPSGMSLLHGYHLAEALRVPSVGLALQPMHPTGEFPPPIGFPSLGSWGNRYLARLMVAARVSPWAGARQFRKALGLSPLSTWGTLRQQAAERWPVHCGFSPTVLPRPADWQPGLDVVGYWWPHDPPAWQPPAELVDFLSAGPPPVLIGLGSMSPSEESERIGELLAVALRKAKVRGVIQSGWAGLMVHRDDVLTVGDIPHSWLFPRMSAVVHHMGAGTTAAGLRAGVPAVGLPVVGDQPFWSRRLVALGASPGFLPLGRLAPDRLASLIRAAVNDPQYRERSRRIAASLASEDGPQRTVEAVERLLSHRRRSTS